MTTRERVRVKTGVPEASDFDSPLGTPIVIDDTAVTGTLYFLDANEAIRAVAGPFYYDTWTPTITAGSGTITTKSGTGTYRYIGGEVLYTVDISITTNGTGAGSVRFTTPFTAAEIAPFAGFETAATSLPLGGYLNGTTGLIVFADGTYPGGDGYRLFVRGSCRV